MSPEERNRMRQIKMAELYEANPGQSVVNMNNNYEAVSKNYHNPNDITDVEDAYAYAKRRAVLEAQQQQARDQRYYNRGNDMLRVESATTPGMVGGGYNYQPGATTQYVRDASTISQLGPGINRIRQAQPYTPAQINMPPILLNSMVGYNNVNPNVQPLMIDRLLEART